MPLMLIESGSTSVLPPAAGARPQKVDTSDWQRLLQVVKNPEHTVEIAVAGKYIELHDAYKSIYEVAEPRRHRQPLQGQAAQGLGRAGRQRRPEACSAASTASWCPGGFGERGFEGKIAAIRYARSTRSRSSASATACRRRSSSSRATSPA
jgi:CTP synthase